MSEFLIQKLASIVGSSLGLCFGYWICLSQTEQQNTDSIKANMVKYALAAITTRVLLEVFVFFGISIYPFIYIFLFSISIYFFYAVLTWRKRLHGLGTILVSLEPGQNSNIFQGKVTVIVIISLVSLILYFVLPSISDRIEQMHFFLFSLAIIALLMSCYCRLSVLAKNKYYLCENGLFYPANSMKWEDFVSYEWERDEVYYLRLKTKNKRFRPDYLTIVIDPPFLRHQVESALQTVGLPKIQDAQVTDF